MNDVAHLCVWRDDGESNPMREKLRKLSTIHPMMGSRLPPRMSIHNNLHQPMQSNGSPLSPDINHSNKTYGVKWRVWEEPSSHTLTNRFVLYGIFTHTTTLTGFLVVKGGLEPP